MLRGIQRSLNYEMMLNIVIAGKSSKQRQAKLWRELKLLALHASEVRNALNILKKPAAARKAKPKRTK